MHSHSVRPPEADIYFGIHVTFLHGFNALRKNAVARMAVERRGYFYESSTS
jgi:hypothetical protein